MREDVNGQAAACPAGAAKQPRQQTSYEDYRTRMGISDTLPEDVKYEKLTTMFGCLATAAGRLMANCGDRKVRDARLEEARDQASRELKTEVAGRCAHEVERAIGMVERCLSDMGKSPLAHVNGTSQAFERCCNVARGFREALEGRRDVVEETKALHKPIIAKLDQISCLILSFFMAYQDVLAV